MYMEEPRFGNRGDGQVGRNTTFDMMLNMLEQIRDGQSADEVTACPDMERFDDYGIDEVIALAKHYSK